MNKLTCCPDMVLAQENGTDNEGYSRAVWKCGDSFRIGTRMQDINFCPWCGAKLT